MTERILVCAAWPYANGSLHLGQIAGCNLPADIFVRYHRLRGSEVIMVSGSDAHGTPTTIRAEQEGKTPREIVDHYQQEFLDCWRKLGISFDLYTTTETANHAAVTQDIFLKLLDKGHLEKKTVSQAYCPDCRRFRPDRYVEGTCPHCSSPRARGDQCEACGKPLDPEDLIEPRCRTCGKPVEFRDSEQFFLKLPGFGDRLLEWARKQRHWRKNVRNFTLRFLEDGLIDRAITRDIDWGIPVPVPGFEGKRIYVWFEAVIGYLSATKEWAAATGDPEKWRDFWQDPDSRSYYFLGKDNIFHHTILWPATLMGYEGLNLPYDVPANEFLNVEGRKLSTSQNWAIWLPDYLSRYDPDPLRYMLSANMPETGDTVFSWREFVRRNNDELVATYGNLVHRVLTFTYRNFEGRVPEPGNGDAAGARLEALATETLQQMDELLGKCSFKQALGRAMALAHEANRCLDEQAPWKTIKEDRQAAAGALYTAIQVIAGLRTMLHPFLPFSSEKLHGYLGFEGTVAESGWKLTGAPPGQALREPAPLFTKLDDKVVEEETSRLGSPV
ncbi:MAG: methionine--tRNA ligase [Dehalococcoidales bacterium]